MTWLYWLIFLSISSNSIPTIYLSKILSPIFQVLFVSTFFFALYIEASFSSLSSPKSKLQTPSSFHYFVGLPVLILLSAKHVVRNLSLCRCEMEECTGGTGSSKKRARHDSGELGSDSPESKRVEVSSDSDPSPPESDRVDTEHNKPNSTESNRADNELDPPLVMTFREDILDIFDDQEIVTQIPDLDSVIKSFEDEIIQSSPSLARPPASEFNSDSGDSQPDLGYLLEASDDELGLPPTVAESQAQNQPTNMSGGNEEGVNGPGNMVGFEHELPSYDSFELGLGENNYDTNGNGDFVTVDGLFDHSDGTDFSDFGWRPESLPAL